MTDTYAEAPAPDLRERLDYALGSIADTELATVIATAGLAAVHEEWQRCRVDLAVQEDVARAMALRIAHLTDEARRWKRRWAGAVAQARHEHEAAEQLRSELADYQLAASEHQGEAARTLCGASVNTTLGIRPYGNRLIGPCIRPLGHTDPEHRAGDGVKWAPLVVATADGFTDLHALAMEQLRQGLAEEAAQVDRTLLGVEPMLSICWCGHQARFHVTDDSDTAVCRGCTELGDLHRAFHVHAQEQP